MTPQTQPPQNETPGAPQTQLFSVHAEVRYSYAHDHTDGYTYRETLLVHAETEDQAEAGARAHYRLQGDVQLEEEDGVAEDDFSSHVSHRHEVLELRVTPVISARDKLAELEGLLAQRRDDREKMMARFAARRAKQKAGA